jgi:hypothetical protein
LKTILFLLPTGLSVRNLLATGVVEGLLKNRDVCVVVLTPEEPEDAKRYSRAGDRLIFERLPPRSSSAFTKFLHAVLRRRFYKINGTGSLKILSRGPLASRLTESLVDAILRQPLPRSRAIYGWLRSLGRRFPGVSRDVVELFLRYQPSLVVSSTFTTMWEYSFIRHAAATGIASVGIVKSWDVLTTKGYIPSPLDYYLVWNQTMKDEMTRVHQVPEDRVWPVGVTQFDVYADRSGLIPREQFLRDHGLDPARKTILYATSTPEINPEDPQVLRRLVTALDQAPNTSAQILVRIHPLDSMVRYRGVSHPHLAFQVPGAYLANSGDRRLLDPDFLVEMRDTLLHCDVVVNTASTISLDGVAMDKPVIAIAFDLEPRHYNRSASRYYDLAHYRPVVDSGATKIGRTFEECLALIIRYLNTPELESRERASLRETMCYKVDGRSSWRVTELILGVLDGHALATTYSRLEHLSRR